MPSQVVDFTNLPGAQDRVDLNIDQGPPAPLNLEPFGPNPWAGGGSVVNAPTTGTQTNLPGGKSIWGAVLILAILFL